MIISLVQNYSYIKCKNIGDMTQNGRNRRKKKGEWAIYILHKEETEILELMD